MAPEARSFGHLLRRYRLAALLTQEQLAARAQLSHRTISDLERGAKHTPRRDTVLLLAEALALLAPERAALIAAAHPVDQQPEVPALPAGQGPPPPSVRTFLIADLRGYTSFTEAQGDEIVARLTSRFVALVRECAAEHGGELVETRGDEVLVTFASARQALRAAAQLQEVCAQAVRADPTVPLQVGIGLDAGEAVAVEGRYQGGTLDLAARLCALAGPREIFASAGVVHLARKVEGLVFVDRGAVQLKGLSEPVRVMQIAPEGRLPPDLPPLQPIPVTHPTNLPDEPTPFIGREREIEAIGALLRRPAVRLATLTGVGGSGKTRLALQVGALLLQAFPAGVFFVPLASVGDPALVLSTIATTLGVQEAGARPLLEVLVDQLCEKPLLLVLDNFEHLLAAAGTVGMLLDRCPQLKVLVTSRALLHLAREHAFDVLPLTVPDPKQLPDLARLSQYEAVALFIDRAQAAKAGFRISNENAPAVAEICYRLEGLPLAIELAAARIRMFPPQALLGRLGSRLRLLLGGARDREARQQTLRRTIDWSYDLLGESERRLFARLSVFAGGCTLEGAETVCAAGGDLGIAILDGIASLIEQSLLREEGEDEPRFWMLETLREYATERLEASGDAEEVRGSHAAYYRQLAEEAEPGLKGPGQTAWLRRLDTEHDNIRSALAWALERGQVETALGTATPLVLFWFRHGHLREGRSWLLQGLASSAPVSPKMRADALGEEGWLAWAQGAWQEAMTLAAQSLAIARGLGEKRSMASALNTLGAVAAAQEQYERAAGFYQESLALHKELGDQRGVAVALGNLGQVALYQGDLERAAALLGMSLSALEEQGDRWYSALTRSDLGSLALAQGDDRRAAVLYAESLVEFRELGDRWGSAWCLEGLADVAHAQGKAGRALSLYGAAASLQEMTGAPSWPADRMKRERTLAAIRAQIGDVTFATAWEQGRAMTQEEAIAYALDDEAGQ